MSFVISDSLDSVRAARTTLLPFNANVRAIASPIPEEAPVMITTLSLKSFFILLLFSQTIRYAKIQNSRE
jgi:hypothetical protein